MTVYELIKQLIEYGPDTDLKFKICASRLQVEEYEKECEEDDYDDYVEFRAYNVSNINSGFGYVEIELEVDSL